MTHLGLCICVMTVIKSSVNKAVGFLPSLPWELGMEVNSICALFPKTLLLLGFKRLCGKNGERVEKTVMGRWRHAGGSQEALWSSKVKSAKTPGQGAKVSWYRKKAGFK